MRVTLPLWLSIGLTLALPAVAQSSGPELKISNSSNDVTVSWPQSAYYWLLESTTDPVGGSWTNFATASELAAGISFLPPGGNASVATNFSETDVIGIFPATDEQRYFRLKPTTG